MHPLRAVRCQAADLPQLLSDGSTLYVPGVGQWNGTAWAYELTDGLGSVRQLSDARGNIIQRYEYSPFGEVVAAEGQRSSALQYTGEQKDIDTGLIYLRARWYDPATGRFTTRDPFPGFALLPQTLHPYVYTNNNPINLTDPSGEFAFLPLLVVAILGGLIGGVAYYTFQAILNADPCLGVQWHWQEALFWTGVGGGLGGLIGTGIYGGWWIGAHLGWWGATATGGAVALQLRNLFDLAQKVANDLGGRLTGAQGEGWRITLPNAAQGGRDIVIRIMEQGGMRAEPYFRIAVQGKGALTVLGEFSNNPLLTHHPIDVNDLQSTFETIKQILSLMK